MFFGRVRGGNASSGGRGWFGHYYRYLETGLSSIAMLGKKSCM